MSYPRRFVLLLFVERTQTLDAAALAANGGLAQAAIPVHTLLVASQPGATPAGTTQLVVQQGLAARRFDGRPGTA